MTKVKPSTISSFLYLSIIPSKLDKKNTKTTYKFTGLLEWVSDCCLMPMSNFSAISCGEQITFRRDDDHVSFVPHQHA